MMFIIWIKLILLLFVCNLRSYVTFLFYDNNNISITMHEIEDIDVYLQVSRESVLGWSQREILNNIPLARKRGYTDQFIETIIHDGFYEGYSKGWPAIYSHHEINRPYVPYGCWFRMSEESGIFINLGNKILIDVRDTLYKQYNVTDDTYFCSKSMSLGYTSFRLLRETTVCYGDCGKIPFNTTCPPGMILRKGYRAFDICNCSDDNIILNCDGNIVNDMKKPSPITLLDTNRCIMTTNDVIYLKSSQMYKNHNLDMMLYFTTDLLSTNKRNNDRDQILSSITSSMKSTGHTATMTLVLNLETKESNNSKNILFRLQDGKIDSSFQESQSVPLYSMTLDAHTTERQVFTINDIYIGVISNFRYTNPAVHRKWLLDDARCLKKLGAYLIILVGDFDHGLVESLMEYLHTYVDMIIGVDDRFHATQSSYYFHKHKEKKLDDSGKMSNRMLMFERSRNANNLNNYTLNYGKIHIRKMSEYYGLMFDRTTVSII